MDRSAPGTLSTCNVNDPDDLFDTRLTKDGGPSSCGMKQSPPDWYFIDTLEAEVLGNFHLSDIQLMRSHTNQWTGSRHDLSGKLASKT